MTRTKGSLLLGALCTLTLTIAVFAQPLPAQAATAHLKVNPNPVVIPKPGMGGAYEVSWDTATRDGAWITVTVDGGAEVLWKAAAPSAGSAVGLIKFGTVQLLRLYGDKNLSNLVAEVQVTTERPNEACLEGCINSHLVTPHGTYASFVVIATAKLKSMKMTLYGTDGTFESYEDISDSQVFVDNLSILTPNTTYRWVLEARDYAGNKFVQKGDFTTLKRKVEVVFDEVFMIDDSDELSAGDLDFSYLAGEWQSGYDVATIDSGDHWYPNRQVTLLDAPKKFMVGIDVTDDDCLETVLCTEGTALISGQNLSGFGEACVTTDAQDSAGAWLEFDAVWTGPQEAHTFTNYLITPNCKLKFVVEVDFTVSYV